MSALAIRAQRARSNAAISARDADLVVSVMSDNIVVDVAGGPRLVGRDASRAAFAAQFTDVSFRGYEREPDQIVVHDPPTTATERGQWVGKWRSGPSERRMRGHYVAEWRHTDMGWLIEREQFRESTG